jgi:hypothetical protein
VDENAMIFDAYERYWEPLRDGGGGDGGGDTGTGTGTGVSETGAPGTSQGDPGTSTGGFGFGATDMSGTTAGVTGNAATGGPGGFGGFGTEGFGGVGGFGGPGMGTGTTGFEATTAAQSSPGAAAMGVDAPGGVSTAGFGFSGFGDALGPGGNDALSEAMSTNAGPNAGFDALSGGFGGLDQGAFQGTFTGSFGSPAANIAGEFSELGSAPPASNPGFMNSPGTPLSDTQVSQIVGDPVAPWNSQGLEAHQFFGAWQGCGAAGELCEQR